MTKESLSDRLLETVFPDNKLSWGIFVQTHNSKTYDHTLTSGSIIKDHRIGSVRVLDIFMSNNGHSSSATFLDRDIRKWRIYLLGGPDVLDYQDDNEQILPITESELTGFTPEAIPLYPELDESITL